MITTPKASAPNPTFSAVREHPAAAPEDARGHFQARLSVETDVADLVHDLSRGTGNLLILDVRAALDYTKCHIPGAINIPLRQISQATTAAFDPGAMLVTYCWGPGCNSATKAAAKLAQLGFQVKEMIGGLEYWRLEGCPVEGSLGSEAPMHWQHED
jgi:rhodanese-related sulfurtransferase